MRNILNPASQSSHEITLAPGIHNVATNWYTDGVMVSNISHSGVQTQIRRDALRREVARIDGRGNMTRTVYDAYDRVAATIDALTNTTTYAYDAMNRVAAISNALGDAMTCADTIAYAYNARGELTNAVSNVDANYAYQYDDIGNRITSEECGVRSVEYVANELNQYTQIDTASSAFSASPCETFNPEFDDDGNQTLIRTATGMWRVTYNGENRPVLWTCLVASDPIATNGETIAMSYDRMGRRVTKNAERFVYNGYLCVKKIEVSTPIHSSPLPIHCYVWDPTEPIATRPLAWCNSAPNTPNAALYYAHDGNKNVSEAVASSYGVVAHYEYAPFGAVFFQHVKSAVLNPWLFSSECAEDDIGVSCFNYRFSVPVVGSWASRDPVGEADMANLYSFCSNNSISNVDVLGLKCKIVIYGGHADSAQRYMARLSEKGTGPKECGDLVGFVSCFRDKINNEADKKFPGHVIPGMPRNPGPLHKDNTPNPNNYELASVGLSKAWDAAKNAVGSICQSCCCKNVTIVVRCDQEMKELTRRLYVKGMNDRAYPQFDWCGRKETVSCTQRE